MNEKKRPEDSWIVVIGGIAFMCFGVCALVETPYGGILVLMGVAGLIGWAIAKGSS